MAKRNTKSQKKTAVYNVTFYVEVVDNGVDEEAVEQAVTLIFDSFEDKTIAMASCSAGEVEILDAVSFSARLVERRG